MEKKIQNQDARSGMIVPDLVFENLESVFCVKKGLLKFFDAYPYPGYCHPWIRDLENRLPSFLFLTSSLFKHKQVRTGGKFSPYTWDPRMNEYDMTQF
jgi:hypothetical protein